MAADVSIPPRFDRRTTNMEDAASLASARDAQSDEQIIDIETVHGELRTAETFIAALEAFICDVQGRGSIDLHLDTAILNIDTIAFEIKRVVSGVRADLSAFIDAMPAGQLRVRVTS